MIVNLHANRRTYAIKSAKMVLVKASKLVGLKLQPQYAATDNRATLCINVEILRNKTANNINKRMSIRDCLEFNASITMVNDDTTNDEWR